MRRIAVFVLVVAVVVQGVALVREYQHRSEELDTLQMIAKKREVFCGSYRSLMRTTQHDLAREYSQSIKQQAMSDFRLLASDSFFRLCDVQDPGLADDVARARGCYLDREDYGCAADTARRVIEAIPPD